MDEQKTLKILHRALDLACKFIRENPPSEFQPYANNKILLNALMDEEQDPEGLLYAEAFLTTAVIELKEKGLI